MTALVDKAPLRQVATVKQLLANQSAAGQLAAVAASHLNPERMMRTLALSVSKTPKLAECTPMSLLGAMMTSASLGLEPNTPLGLAYLIPFEDRRNKRVEAQLIIGYRGYIQLGHNSPALRHLGTGVHYDTDKEWDWAEGGERVLKHRPGPMKGEIEHAYAIFEKANGGRTWLVWPEDKLAAHRDRYSKGYEFDIKRGKKPTDANVNIWLAKPDIAREKTMIRQIAKVMPMATGILGAAVIDGARADFAGFAIDPGLGSPDIIEHGEDGPIGDDSMIEHDEAPAATVDPRQDQAIPAETGREAIRETAASATQARAGAAASTEQHPNQGAAASNALTSAQERAKAAVAARRAERAGEAAAQENAPAEQAPPADDTRAKHLDWADRIRLDIGDLGAAAFDDWRKEMAEMEEKSPDIAADLRAYAAS